MAKKRRDAGPRRPATTAASTGSAQPAPVATSAASMKSAPGSAQPATKPAKAAPVAADTAFWSGFAVSPAKLMLVRFALFGVLAIDAFFQISHAPRYGSGFNVANLRFLDDLAPGRDAAATIYLALAFLFGAFALGGALRLMPLAALLYNWMYFSSQLDSYQHHYLVSLLLILACFAPWSTPADDRGPRRSWALRLMLVQLGVMYLWATVTKLHGNWLDGTALNQQISTPWMRAMIERGGWPTAATMTLLLELLLAIGVWNRRLWPVVAPLGITFHVMIELSGLEIGLFSYVMVAIYLLAIPERWIAAARIDRARAAILTALRRLAPRSRAAALIVTAIAAVMVGVVLGLAPLVGAAVVVLGVAAALGGALIAPARAAAHAAAVTAAAVLVLTLGHVTTEVPEYYKFWAGSARRLGHLDEAQHAYARLVELTPSAPAHYYLGTYALQDHHDDDALDHWRTAEAIDPADPRAFVAEARWLEAHDRAPEALARARAALAGRPGDAEATALVARLAPAAP